MLDVSAARETIARMRTEGGGVRGFYASVADGWESALNEVDRLQVYRVAALAYYRIRELDALCEEHPGIGDPIGAAAEAELMQLTEMLQELKPQVTADQPSETLTAAPPTQHHLQGDR
jgi:hypothetical protein